MLCSILILCYQPRREDAMLAFTSFMSLWIRALAKCLKWKVWIWEHQAQHCYANSEACDLSVPPTHTHTQKHTSVHTEVFSVSLCEPQSSFCSSGGTRSWAFGLIKTKVALKILQMWELPTPRGAERKSKDGKIEEERESDNESPNPGFKKRWTRERGTKRGWEWTN